jgi:hypothetical protein
MVKNLPKRRTAAWEAAVEKTAADLPCQERIRVIWPEDRLMWDYFRKNPEVHQIPYALNSFNPPFVKRFALRQYQLMQQGKTKEDAYEIVSKEMMRDKSAEMRCDVHALRRCFF